MPKIYAKNLFLAALSEKAFYLGGAGSACLFEISSTRPRDGPGGLGGGLPYLLAA